MADSDPATGEGGLVAGSVIDRYVILAPLGQGAMGAVYAAHDPRLDRSVALKILHVGDPDELDRAAARLQREARAMARLSHPNIVAIHEVGIAGARLFLAVERLDARTLVAWSAERRHTWAEVLAVLIPAGRGLAAAHRAGLVHRDFKPDNVLVGSGREPGVWVADFGLARAIGEREPEHGGASTAEPGVEITRAGLVVGTPAYMAPEQHAGRSPDGRADQFSWAVVSFEALFGARPFVGDTPDAITAEVLRGRIAIPPTWRTVPGWLRAVITRALAADPRHRYPTMVALLDDLERRRTRRRRRMLVGAGALVLAAIPTVVWLEDRATVAACARDEVHVWNDERRAALGDSGLDDPQRRALEGALDHIDAASSAARRGVCLRDPERDELALRRACLDDRADELALVLDAIAGNDPARLERAAFALDALPPPEPCELDAGVLEAASLPAATRHQLAVARVEARIGSPTPTLPIVEEARAQDDQAALAHALLLDGRLAAEQGALARAEAALREAAWAAEAIRHDHTVAEAMVELVGVIGEDPLRADEAAALARDAEAAIDRIGAPAQLQRRLAARTGEAAIVGGDTEGAVEPLTRAIALGVDDPRPTLLQARTFAALALAHARLGAHDESLAAAVQALALAQAIYGPGHPALADYAIERQSRCLPGNHSSAARNCSVAP